MNLFDSLPDTAAVECVDILLARPRIRIERIVSFGQANPPGFWYDQEETPSASRSTQGEMHQPQAGCGNPASRIAIIADTTSPPPALSPAIVTRSGL